MEKQLSKFAASVGTLGASAGALAAWAAGHFWTGMVALAVAWLAVSEQAAPLRTFLIFLIVDPAQARRRASATHERIELACYQAESSPARPELPPPQPDRDVS